LRLKADIDITSDIII